MTNICSKYWLLNFYAIALPKKLYVVNFPLTNSKTITSKHGPLSIKDVFFNPETQNIWLASHIGIHAFIYQEEKNSYEFEDKIIMPRAYAVANQNNIVWFGRMDGLYYIYEDSIDVYQVKTENLDNFKGYLLQDFSYKINDLAIDNSGQLWIATDGFGLYTCKKCLEEELTLIEGTKGAIIQELFIDEDNQVWMATSKGLIKLSQSTNKDKRYDIQTYGAAHGLPSQIINSVFVKDSVVYVGTSEGITIMRSFLLRNKMKPRLIFSNIKINDNDTIIANKYNLKHHQNSIFIKYLGLSFKSQGTITYKYKMEGIDKEWRTTTLREREYPDLTSGTYTFLVQAIDISCITSEIQKITFVVRKPWWRTIYFIISIALLALLAGFMVFKWRLRLLNYQQRQKRDLDKKFAELELNALQAQMNPHFIFNALTAIQNFILDNNHDAADTYLVKFSRLMRSFLDASKEKHITLHNEIKLLRLYVELEQLRFGDKFDVKWMIDEEVDEFIDIPSMIFQPFVENAINHGLLYKEDKGLLLIHFYYKNNTLFCTIEDNGVGRIKSMEIQEQSRKSHKSRGMSIIEDRLKTLQIIEDLKVDIEIIDLYHDNQLPAGTRVNISLQ